MTCEALPLGSLDDYTSRTMSLGWPAVAAAEPRGGWAVAHVRHVELDPVIHRIDHASVKPAPDEIKAVP